MASGERLRSSAMLWLPLVGVSSKSIYFGDPRDSIYQVSSLNMWTPWHWCSVEEEDPINTPAYSTGSTHVHTVSIGSATVLMDIIAALSYSLKKERMTRENDPEPAEMVQCPRKWSRTRGNDTGSLLCILGWESADWSTTPSRWHTGLRDLSWARLDVG